MVVRQDNDEATPQRERQANGPSRTSGETFLAHPTFALGAACVMLAFVVLIAILVPAGPLGLDRSWSEAMRHLETPFLTHLALVFNWLGRGPGRAFALALVGLLLLRRRRWLALVAFAVAESLAPLLSALLKLLVDRARPTGSSTPSDPPSPPAMPPTPARPVSRSSSSPPHPAPVANGGGHSPASALSAWPGVAHTCKSTC
jgi:hypothetical protein